MASSANGSRNPEPALPDEIQSLPSSDHLDLHSFIPAEVTAVVEEYLRQCQADGQSEVRLIHGKGKGVQRARVQHLLERLDIVAAFADAPPEQGHWGATLVWLKPLPSAVPEEE